MALILELRQVLIRPEYKGHYGINVLIRPLWHCMALKGHYGTLRPFVMHTGDYYPISTKWVYPGWSSTGMALVMALSWHWSGLARTLDQSRVLMALLARQGHK